MISSPPIKRAISTSIALTSYTGFMAFIINKPIKYHTKYFGSRDKTYYYIVEGYREGAKVKRRKIYSLGENKNLSERLDALDKKIKTIKDEIKKYEQKIDDMRHGKFGPLVSPRSQYRNTYRFLNEAKLKIPDAEREKDEVKKLMAKYPNCCAKTL